MEMKMKRLSFGFLFAILISLMAVFATQAQGDELPISFSRDFGYASGGGDIQGLFSIKVTGPDTLTKVSFYIDDTMIGDDTEAPFKLQFNTDNFSLGEHAVYAVGTTSDGKELKTKVVHANFVSASQGSQAAMRILIPVLGLVVVSILLATVVPILTGRKTLPLEPGTPRNYPMGGAICPKCQRPFAVHIYGVNLGFSKFDRCPYCGKWSLVRREPMQKLRAAEEAELAHAQETGQVQGMTEEEKLRKQLEDSRFQ
jgi:Bacterial Ig domain